MKKRFAHLERNQPKPVPYQIRLPASVVDFLRKTARETGLTQQRLAMTLLLVGIEIWEEEHPLKGKFK